MEDTLFFLSFLRLTALGTTHATMINRATLHYLLLVLILSSWVCIVVSSQNPYDHNSQEGRRTILGSHQRRLELGKNPVYRDQAEEACKIISGSLIKIPHDDGLVPSYSLNYGLFWALCLDEINGNSVGMYIVQSNECVSKNLDLKEVRMHPLCQLIDWRKRSVPKNLTEVRFDIEEGHGFRRLLVWWLNALSGRNKSLSDSKLKEVGVWKNKSITGKNDDFRRGLALDPANRFPTMRGRRKRRREQLKRQQQKAIGDDEMIRSRTSQQIFNKNISTSNNSVRWNTSIGLTKEAIQFYSRYHCVFGLMAFLSVIISIIAFFMESCLYCRKRDELENKQSTLSEKKIIYLTKDVWIAFFLHIFHVLVSLVLFVSAICAWAEIAVLYDNQPRVTGDIIYGWLKWVIDVEISKYLCPVAVIAFFCALFARLAFMCSQNFLISCNYESHPRGCCGCSSSDNEQQSLVTPSETPFGINYQQIILWCSIFIIAVGGSFLLYRVDQLGPSDGISIYGLFWIKDQPSLFFTAAIIKFVVFVLPSVLVIPIWFYMFCMYCCNPCQLRSISDKNLLEQTSHAILVSTVMMVFIATANVIEFIRLAWGEANDFYNYIFIPILTGSQLLLCFFFSFQPIFFSFYGYYCHPPMNDQKKTE